MLYECGILNLSDQTGGDWILALDYGSKYLGVAVGNLHSGATQPLTTLQISEKNPPWQQLHRLLSEWKCRVVVVGLPLNMNDSEGAMTRKARKFAADIAKKLCVRCEMHDERLTSWQVEQNAASSGARHETSRTRQAVARKARRMQCSNRIHSHAAELIAASWLIEQVRRS